MVVDIITIFPRMFIGAFDEGILRRARQKGLVEITLHPLRAFAIDKWGTVDDYPYGGGAGMVLRPEPIAKALEHVRRLRGRLGRVIFLTPQGERLSQEKVNELSLEEHLVLLCGRYKGIDERIRQKYVTDEISIGDYVLSGGEFPAMVLVDAVVRLLPGALGDAESALEDSFQTGLLDAPWYTRPEAFEGMKVPEVLLSGDHKRIKEWRLKESMRRTRERRPDLWKKYQREQGALEA